MEAGDAELVERSRDEPELFAVIFDRHAPTIHRYAHRRLGSSAADDVVAETFLAAFRQRGRYDRSRAEVRPWLYGIASNVIGKYRRAEVRMYRAVARTGADLVVEPYAEGVEDRVVARDAIPELGSALAKLSKRQRDVLLLYAWVDLSYAEIATALSIPVGTVRSRMNRARQTLRRALGGSDPTIIMEENINHA